MNARFDANSLLCAASTLFFCVSAPADVVFLNPSADATLYQVAPQNSSGGWENFIAGTTQNRTLNRALMKFDIASMVPSGAHINGVTLDIDVTHRPGCGFEASLFGLHRMLQDWGEGVTVPIDNPGGMGAPANPGDATWLYRHAFSDSWALPGGAPGIDFVSDYSASSFIFDVDVYQFESTAELTADVQYWVDHPQSNFGWMLKTESEELPFTARRFASRENAGGGPFLTIDFTPVPEPSTLALAALSLIFAICYSRGMRKC